MQHFILTRFNLLLWQKDKGGSKVRTVAWLEHRFNLFEQYCLPSIINQTCHEFGWIVLFDNTTPEPFKKKVEEYQIECPQMIPVYVEPQNGRYFAEIFRQEVVSRLRSQEHENERISLTNTNDTNHTDKCFKRVLTTYLDNDDALNVRFVEDIQRRVSELPNGTFISYTDGYQYYTDYKYVMQIHYPRNHFMSVVEEGNPAMIKTIYGYGSHYYIEKIPGVKIEKVKNLPMWCEVIHEKNMGNDAYFLDAKMVKEAKGFGFMFQDSSFNYSFGVYLFRYLPRYTKTFVRRIGYRLFGRHW